MSFKVSNTKITNSDVYNANYNPSTKTQPSFTYTMTASINLATTNVTGTQMVPFLDSLNNNIKIQKGLVVGAYISTSTNLSSATPTLSLIATNTTGTTSTAVVTDKTYLTDNITAVASAVNVKVNGPAVNAPSGSCYTHNYLYLISDTTLTSGVVNVTLIIAV